MKHSQSSFKTTYLKDYKAPDFLIETATLTFDLDETATQVESSLIIKRHPKADKSAPLILDGEQIELRSVALNGATLSESDYTQTEESLTVHTVPEEFELIIKNQINPKDNTELSGLYVSSQNFCTQCEAHGFRRITYFIDRPDNLSIFTTHIIADKSKYPLLLSNGNLLEKKELDDNRHQISWYDPHKKPSYLFALVAGDLDCYDDQFTTQSGRDVTLKLYVEKGNLDKCEHAMTSLKQSMAWDESVYGREYDLDIFMIVAVSDFNMGAMENKGLNIFNDKYILAKPETATDFDYEAIESVVAHEYFHNWTGNRVTCRDWFQLSLKEGLTVFRDQEFSRDMNSRDVNRIQDVEILRAHQFPEDDSPLAHPVRPDAYVEINNFYTSTVYNKGAEVIRMQHTLLGADGFRQGMDLYFDRHDGQAVTTDDFVQAMMDANDFDMTQFKRWYQQSGTPVVRLKDEYDADNKTLHLHFEQWCPDTPGQKDKKPFHIPFAIGLLGSQGDDLIDTQVLSLTEAKQTITLTEIEEKPVLSLLRDFSAPIKLEYDYQSDDLFFLLAHDSNGFSRWEASQTIAIRFILDLIEDYHHDKPLQISDELINAYRSMLNDAATDNALKAKILTLPAFNTLAEKMPVIDVAAIHTVKKFVKRQLAEHLYADLLAQFKSLQDFSEFKKSGADIAARSLKNVCLDLLMMLDNEDAATLCLAQFKQGTNMTDVISAMACFSHHDSSERQQVLTEFYNKWKDDSLVIDKWFSIQAKADLPDTLEQVKSLMQHTAFEMKNPNRLRALVGAFAAANPAHFHSDNGEGYAFLADQVLAVDDFNPQVASRLAVPFTRWRKYDDKRKQFMRMQLERIMNKKSISKDVHEIVSKSLKED